MAKYQTKKSASIDVSLPKIIIKGSAKGGSIKSQKAALKELKDMESDFKKIIAKSGVPVGMLTKIRIYCSECQHDFKDLDALEAHLKKTGHKDE